MKQTAFLLIVLAGLILTACGVSLPGAIRGSGILVSEAIPVSSFTRVLVEAAGDVIIEQGETESLIIEAEDNIMPYIVGKVEGDQLILSVEPNALVQSTRPVVYRLQVKDLNEVILTGSGNVSVSSLKADHFAAVVRGSGDLMVEDLEVEIFRPVISGSGRLEVKEIQAQEISSQVTDSGDLEMAGTAGSHSADVTGSGNILAGSLQTSQASITVRGSGDSLVWVTEKLEIVLSGSGKVQYYGKPQLVTSGDEENLTALGSR